MKKKTVKRLLCLSFALLFSICAFQVSGGVSGPEKVNASATNAKVETWVEQNFWDVFWGNGVWQTRTKYTIDPYKANTAVTYENKKLLLSTSNKTKVNQTASYSYSSTVGHSFNATVSAKKGHFQAALGYTLTSSSTTTYTANINVPKKSSIRVWGSDIRIKSQYTTYKTQPQRSSFRGWINNGNASTTRPLIKQYSGKHISWTYA